MIVKRYDDNCLWGLAMVVAAAVVGDGKKLLGVWRRRVTNQKQVRRRYRWMKIGIVMHLAGGSCRCPTGRRLLVIRDVWCVLYFNHGTTTTT
jgi:hypothetical protein